MARPRKCRRICELPRSRRFGPLGPETEKSGDGDAAAGQEDLIMALDEYETIRLIDLLDCTQEECAEQMGVARTTVQAVYNNARQKLACALVEGRQLSIRGGDYVVCSESGGCCRKSCGRRSGCGTCGGGEKNVPPGVDCRRKAGMCPAEDRIKE